MIEVNKQLVFAFLIAVLVWLLVGPKFEGFGEEEEFKSPYFGQPEYGLRGDKLHWSSIDQLYYSPYRQIVLSGSGGWMDMSDKTPAEQGMKGCNKVKCPTYGNGYDSEDTCWQCASGCPKKMKIPYIHPHVPN